MKRLQKACATAGMSDSPELMQRVRRERHGLAVGMRAMAANNVGLAARTSAP